MNIPLLIIIAILVLGIINIIASLVKVNKQKSLLDTYVNTVLNLLEKIDKREDYGQEAVYLISKTEDVAEIENAYLYSNVYDLKNDISRRDVMGIKQTGQKICAESIVWNDRLDKQVKTICWQFANPFIWFYKGVELILHIVFGYFIRIVNPKFDFHSKGWKVFNTVFSIVSGTASIVALIMELNN